MESQSAGGSGAWCRGAPPVLPTPEILPVLRPERAQDRLQGRQAACSASSRSAARSCPSRITAVSTKRQRELAQAIKRARFLGLLPYMVK